MSWLDVVLDFLYRLAGYRKVTATSTVKSNGGTTLVGYSVTLTYERSKSGTWSTDGTSSTNQSGVATDSVYLKKGTYDLRMTVQGANGYRSAYAELDNYVVL